LLPYLILFVSILVRQLTFQLTLFFYMSEDNFFERVCSSKTIPFGRVTSYGAIAKAIGAGRSARRATNASHTIDDVPAHRVVNRKGLLTGKFHFDGTNLTAVARK
jgi:methylated-DNA-protein-cysteine methyltransferase-like protein